MKSLTLSGMAFALLAGTAMTTLPAASQEAKQPRILPQGEQTGEAPQPNANSGKVQGSGQIDATSDTAADQAGEQSSEEPAQSSGQSAGDADQPSDQSARDEAPGQKAQTGEVDSAKDAAPGQMQKSGEAESATEAAPGQVKDGDQAATDRPSDETTASINITEEQKTEIHSVILESDVEPVDVDIDIDVGVSVPTTIELHPLPTRIVEIVPEYEGYMYFVLADGRIIIVEPDTHEVVYIIVA